MKTIPVSDENYDTILRVYGEPAELLERLAAEADVYAAVMEGVEDYKAGRHQSVEDFGKDISEEFGIKLDT